MTIRTRSIIYLLITALLWSSSGVLVKSIEWNPLALASSRALVAALTIAFLAGGSMSWARPGRSQWLGAAFMAMVHISFVCATKMTTAANAILLQYTAPVWVALFAPLILRERTSGRDWFFILITFGGMGLFFMDSISTKGLLGIIIAIFCGMAFAGLAINLRYTRGQQQFQGVIYGNLLTAVVGLLFWQPPWPSLGDAALILAAGVIQSGVAYYLFTRASEGVSSLELVLITAVEPILNPVWVFLVIGERPGKWAMFGGMIVLITITAWSVLKTIKPSPSIGR